MHITPPQPYPVADDTFLLPGHLGDPRSPYAMQVNSMVILGSEPVVVDTGAFVNREAFFGQLHELVDPAQVRWVFLSHADADHAGNLSAVLDSCGGATLATGMATIARLAAGGLTLPPERWLIVSDGDFVDIGDRVLVVQRPPLYDSAAMLGLFDTQTEVFWGADSFGSAHWSPALEAIDVALDIWRQGFIDFQQWQSPWLEGFDGRWWNHVVDRFAARRPQAIASAHGQIIRESRIPIALDLLRELPQLPIRQPAPDRVRELIVDPGCPTF